MAMIFQDPLSAMHPYYTIGAQIAEAYRVHNSVSRKIARARAIEMLDRVGIPQASTRVDAYPHQFSGGQRQRISIARALAPKPHILLADEPVSALDVSVRAQVLNLLADLVAELGLTLVFVSHDLSVVRHVCDRVAVMRGGQVIESGDVDQLYEAPEHPYTQRLLRAVPTMRKALSGAGPAALLGAASAAMDPSEPTPPGPAVP
jgi:ABC-type dipeptide/oligopeptide/nickel transport system ATPase component